MCVLNELCLLDLGCVIKFRCFVSETSTERATIGKRTLCLITDLNILVQSGLLLMNMTSDAGNFVVSSSVGQESGISGRAMLT